MKKWIRGNGEASSGIGSNGITKFVMSRITMLSIIGYY